MIDPRLVECRRQRKSRGCQGLDLFRFLSLNLGSERTPMTRDTLAEWLRRWPAKPLGSPAQAQILQVSFLDTERPRCVTRRACQDVDAFVTVACASQSAEISRSKADTILSLAALAHFSRLLYLVVMSIPVGLEPTCLRCQQSFNIVLSIRPLGLVPFVPAVIIRCDRLQTRTMTKTA